MALLRYQSDMSFIFHTYTFILYFRGFQYIYSVVQPTPLIPENVIAPQRSHILLVVLPPTLSNLSKGCLKEFLSSGCFKWNPSLWPLVLPPLSTTSPGSLVLQYSWSPSCLNNIWVSIIQGHIDFQCFIYYDCVCVYRHTHSVYGGGSRSKAHVWSWSGDHSVEPVLSIHLDVGSRDGVQLSGLVAVSYPLRHHNGPLLFSLNIYLFIFKDFFIYILYV